MQLISTKFSHQVKKKKKVQNYKISNIKAWQIEYYTEAITLTLSRMTNGPATPDTVLYSAAQRDNS